MTPFPQYFKAKDVPFSRSRYDVHALQLCQLLTLSYWSVETCVLLRYSRLCCPSSLGSWNQNCLLWSSATESCTVQETHVAPWFVDSTSPGPSELPTMKYTTNPEEITSLSLGISCRTTAMYAGSNLGLLREK